MTRLERALDGKELPKNVTLYHDENTGALEVRFWRLYPLLLFMIPFMCVWTYFTVGKMYVEPFLAGQPIRNAAFGIPFVLGALFFWGGDCSAAIRARTIVSGAWTGPLCVQGPWSWLYADFRAAWEYGRGGG